MKIGIVTVTGYFNYGNRLQNFAVQKVMKSLELTPETIEVINTLSKKEKIKQTVLLGISLLFSEKVVDKYNANKIIKKIYIKKIDRVRERRIYDWSKKNIVNSKLKIIDINIPIQLDKSFDYFVTGSDQVWNPHHIIHHQNYFLNFTKKEKRIAYAASFGINAIPAKYKEDYTKYLNEMNYLSVREDAGQKIIKDLTGRNSEVLIDPTMMLDKAEWLKVSSKPKCMPKKKYLLTYVLGNQTEEFKEFIFKLAKEKNLEILNLLNPSNKDIHCVDPGEFVYLINEADVMITDSFHGAVFSILMETPFVIFERQDKEVSMNSRIDTLVSTFKMESRLSTHIKSIDDVYNIDFSHIDRILEHEREKAINYLKNAFSMN